MRPKELKTKIFLDSADPKETKTILDKLGFLDGQTTNPTLVAKSPKFTGYFQKNGKIDPDTAQSLYKDVVLEIHNLIPNGMISIEPYVDGNSELEYILEKAREVSKWCPNSYVKLPIIKRGIEALSILSKEGIRINMTLCFAEQQAAVVYNATKNHMKGSVYISPFVGRLEDNGYEGVDLVSNILNLYKGGDGRVSVLGASVRSLFHFQYLISIGCDIITAPFSVLNSWADQGMEIPNHGSIKLPSSDRQRISQAFSSLPKNSSGISIEHPLTDQGLEKFVKEWNSVVQ